MVKPDLVAHGNPAVSFSQAVGWHGVFVDPIRAVKRQILYCTLSAIVLDSLCFPPHILTSQAGQTITRFCPHALRSKICSRVGASLAMYYRHA